MPTICSFYGILIRMYFNDHAPPHFHARYGEFEATVDGGNRRFVARSGIEPGHRMGHRAQLLENWRLCRENSAPAKIEPLS